MQRFYLLAAVSVACLSFTVWYLLDPPAFVLYNYYKLNDHIQRPPVSNNSSRSSSVLITTFAFYKFSLQWPPSTCSTLPRPGLNCSGSIPAEFTIHGLWPQDANDNPIPPYQRNRSCNTNPPMPSSQIIPYLQPIQVDLEQLWPNLKNSTSRQQNQAFWRYEWEQHGMCSDYGQDPLGYFNSTLQLRKTSFDPAFQLTPGTTYTVRWVSNEISRQVGAKPEIACSTSRLPPHALLLWEVRLCYNKQTYPGTRSIQNCPKKFSGGCRNWNDNILFPN